MRVKRAAAQAIIDAIVSRMPVQLAQAPTVITAPPSQKSAYPAMAILIDSADIEISNDDEDVQFDPLKQPGDEGFELTGFFRTDPSTNDYVVGDTYMVDQSTTISQVGSVRMKGRLWVGARLDPQRETIEQEIALIFYEDRAAPGRLQVSVAGIEIKGVKIPFGIATAFFEDKIQWNNEFAFAERLWTYMPISIDVPLMIPRTDPIVQQLLLIVSEDLRTPVNIPPDVDNLVDAQTFSIDQSGNATLI